MSVANSQTLKASQNAPQNIPKHRLGDEWLVGLASGTLSEGEAMFARTCLSFVPEAANDLALAQTLGGAALERAPQAALKADARASLLAALDGAEMEPATSSPAPSPAPRKERQQGGVMPAVLQDYAGGDVDRMKWSYLGPGMKKVRLWQNDKGQTLWMLRAQPGVKIPEHTHEGTELTLVLKGSFHDAFGHYGPGDVEETDNSHTHDLVIDEGGECICLALTDRPLKFKGWIARAMQPFIGL